MKAWGAAVLVALIVAPAGAKAKPGFFVQGPQRWSEFTLPATHGYRVRVSATKPAAAPLPNVYVIASRGRARTVEYSIRGRSRPDGMIDARLPGIGRIAVRFVSMNVSREPVADNCKGRPSVVRHGVFRGTILIHGEQGYTSLSRRSASGKVTQSFRQVCDQREAGAREGAPIGAFHQKALFAGVEEGPQRVSFQAWEADFGSNLGPIIFFIASSERHDDGLHVSNRASASGKASEFSTPDPPGVLEDATVEPPPPFRGSATFHLDSPTSSSWTGTLGVELPGIGPIALAGSDFWSALCEDAACTKTLPPNVRIFTFGSSGR